MANWKTEFPKTDGFYWFYGYRYGKDSGWPEKPNKPELMFMKATKIPNGWMYTGDGAFVHESEVEEPHFLPVELPELPDME